MTNKCTCTKFGAAMLFAVGAALLMPPETLAQTASRKPGVATPRKGERVIQQTGARPKSVINSQQRGFVAPMGGGIAGTSNCCQPHATPGCDDPKCEALI